MQNIVVVWKGGGGGDKGLLLEQLKKIKVQGKRT